MSRKEGTVEKNPSSSGSSLDEKFQCLTDAYLQGKTRPTKPLIQKVQFALRGHKNFDKHFLPRAVPLGPIHHCKFKYKLAEGYKNRLAEHFIVEAEERNKSYPVHNDLREYKQWLYEKVAEKIGELRRCYEEEVTEKYSDEDLAWMLFVDGCSLLTFIKSVAENKLADLNVKNDLAAFGQQDTFLLENQLPYQLLQLLMQSTNQEEIFVKSINTFINNNIMEVGTRGDDQSPTISSDCPHLLHLLRERLLFPASNNSSNETKIRISKDARINQKKEASNEGKSLKNCLFRTMKEKKNYKRRDIPTFRNIKELKAAGIKLEPSKSSFLSDIVFSRGVFSATLFLPPIEVDDWTEPKLLNLVAYEMCPDFFNDFDITSYVCFLDSLIDQAEDVKELRDAKILYNILGSDEEVAKLFNEISTDLVPNGNSYWKVKKDIQKHYENPIATWATQGYHAHFSSPWTTSAFLAALIGLGLSFIQAWKALFPSKS